MGTACQEPPVIAAAGGWVSPPLPPDPARRRGIAGGPERSRLPRDPWGSTRPVAAGEGRVVSWCGAAPASLRPAQHRERCPWCWRWQGPRHGAVLPWVCLEGNGAGGWRWWCSPPGSRRLGRGGSRQKRAGDVDFFFIVLVLAWKGPAAFYKTTSLDLPGLGLAHHEPEGR